MKHLSNIIYQKAKELRYEDFVAFFDNRIDIEEEKQGKSEKDVPEEKYNEMIVRFKTLLSKQKQHYLFLKGHKFDIEAQFVGAKYDLFQEIIIEMEHIQTDFHAPNSIELDCL